MREDLILSSKLNNAVEIRLILNFLIAWQCYCNIWIRLLWHGWFFWSKQNRRKLKEASLMGIHFVFYIYSVSISLAWSRNAYITLQQCCTTNHMHFTCMTRFYFMVSNVVYFITNACSLWIILKLSEFLKVRKQSTVGQYANFHLTAP